MEAEPEFEVVFHVVSPWMAPLRGRLLPEEMLATWKAPPPPHVPQTKLDSILGGPCRYCVPHVALGKIMSLKLNLGVTQNIVGHSFSSFRTIAREDGLLAFVEHHVDQQQRQLHREAVGEASGAEAGNDEDEGVSVSNLLKFAENLEAIDGLVCDELVRRLGRTVTITVENIDVDKPIYATGVDSLVVVEFSNEDCRFL